MDGRTFSSTKYRYGFNGKEKDDEVSGTGNDYDYGLRIYNPRLGKFLSVDPMFASYPWNSSYSYAENDVIRCIDLDGAEKQVNVFYPERNTAQLTNLGAGDLDWIVAKDFVRMNNLPDNGVFQVFNTNERTYATYSFAIDGKGYTATISNDYLNDAYRLAMDERASSEEFYGKITEGVSFFANMFTSEIVLPEIMPSGTSSSSGTIKEEIKVEAKIEAKIEAKTVEEETVVEVTVSKSKHPEAAEHIEEAQQKGQPMEGIVDRAGKADRRKEAMKGVKTVAGKDRDEYPPAIIKTTSPKASVKPICPYDNRGAGGSMGQQLKGVPNGTKVKITVVD